MNFDGMFKLKFTEALWMRLWYKYIDFTDDAPYLYDTSGTVHVATVTAGWSF